MNNCRKKFIFILFISLVNLKSFAQELYKSAENVTFQNGPEHTDDWGTYLVKVIGQDSTGIYALRMNYSNRHFFLEKYDQDMNKVFSIKVDTLHKRSDMPMYTPAEFLVQDAYLLKGRIYVFGSIYDYRKNLNILYGASYNSSGERDIDITQICTITAEEKANAGYFDLSISNDSTTISLMKVEKFSQLKKERFSLFVMDTKLNILWTKDLELPYKDDKTNILRMLVDNEGNIHLLVKVWLEDKELKTDEPDYYYTLYSYYYREGLLKQHELSLGETFISSISIYLNDQNNLSGVGFYSEKKWFKMKGVFAFSVNPQNRVLTFSTQQDFSPAFIAQFVSPSKSLQKALAAGNIDYLFKKAEGLSNFAVRNIITKKDSSLTLVAEYFYDAGHTSYTSKYNSSGTNYAATFNDLIIATINPDGKVAWTKKVGKKQTSGTGYYLISYYNRRTAPVGITSFEVGNQAYIIYNEAPSNYKDTSDISNVKLTMSNANLSVTTLVGISDQGKVSKIPLFLETDSNYFITPGFTQQFANDTLLLYAEKGSTYRFVKIKFK